MSRNSTSIITLTASVVLAGSLLAACGGGGSSTTKTGGSGSGSGASNGVVTQAGQGARLSQTVSGLDLWTWVPNGMYPSGISETPNGAYNTDAAIKVNSAHDLASMSCTQTLEYIGGPGYGEEAYMLDSGQNSAGNQFYSYGAYEFPTAEDATAFVKAQAAKFAGCGSFTAQGSNTSFPATLSVGPASAAQVPDANAAVDLRESASSGGKTEVGDMVLAADGNIVVAVTSSSTTGTLPTEVSNAAVAQKLLEAFASNEAQGNAVITGSPGATGSAGDRIRVYLTDAVRAGVAR